MAPVKDVLNVHEAARFLGVHTETIRRLARNGKIPAFKVGRGWRIRLEALLKWADTQTYQDNQSTILVVDDDKGVQTGFRRILERQDCRHIEAANGDEGLDILGRERIDAIFLDLQMPVMTGPDFLREMHKKGIDVPVTVITGYPDSNLVVEAGRFGPVSILVKPIEKEQLLQALKNMLPTRFVLSTNPVEGGGV